MLAANVIVICVLPTLDGQIELKWHHWLRSFWPTGPGQMAATLFVSAHLSLTGIFGLYVWANPTRILDTSPECAHATITYVLFTPIPATSPRLRMASLVLSSIAAVPILNIAMLTAAAAVVVNFINAFICRPYTFCRLYRFTMLVLALVNALFIANTELTVRRNRILVDGNESTWGLGQILVLFLVIGPIIDLATVCLGKIRNRASVRWKGQVEHTFRQILRGSEETWNATCQQLRQKIDKLLSSLPLEGAPAAMKGVTDALTTAQAFLGAADEQFQPLTTRSESEVDLDDTSDHSTITEKISIGSAKRDVEDIFDRMSVVCGLRFSEMKGPLPSAIARGYLEAARDALGAANVALNACCIDEMLP